MPFMRMEHAVDPAKEITDKVGDISGIEVFNNQVLVAIYLRPEKTKTGIYLPDKHRDEDKFQSKVGLVLKMGPSACHDDGAWFRDVQVNVGDWIVFRPSDGWSISVNDTPCRMLDDVNLRGRIIHPDDVW